MDYVIVAVIALAAGAFCWEHYVTKEVRAKMEEYRAAAYEMGKGIKELL